MSDSNAHSRPVTQTSAPDTVHACPYTKTRSIRVSYPGELDDNAEYQEWLSQVQEYVSKRRDSSVRHRLYVYYHAGVPHVSFDIFHNDSNKDMSMTIAVTDGYCGLPYPIESQIDFELPDLVSVVDFITHIIQCDHKNINHINGRCLLELLAWDRPTETPREPGS